MKDSSTRTLAPGNTLEGAVGVGVVAGRSAGRTTLREDLTKTTLYVTKKQCGGLRGPRDKAELDQATSLYGG